MAPVMRGGILERLSDLLDAAESCGAICHAFDAHAVCCGATRDLVQAGAETICRRVEALLHGSQISSVAAGLGDVGYEAWALTREAGLTKLFHALGLDGRLRRHSRSLGVHGEADVVRAMAGELLRGLDIAADGGALRKELLNELAGAILHLQVEDWPLTLPADIDATLAMLLRTSSVKSIAGRCQAMLEARDPRTQRRLMCTVATVLPQLTVLRLRVFVQFLHMLCRPRKTQPVAAFSRPSSAGARPGMRKARRAAWSVNDVEIVEATRAALAAAMVQATIESGISSLPHDNMQHTMDFQLSPYLSDALRRHLLTMFAAPSSLHDGLRGDHANPSMAALLSTAAPDRNMAALLGTAGQDEPMAALLGTAGLDPGLAALDAEELVRAYQAGMIDEETLRALLEERGEMPPAPSSSASPRGPSRRPSPTGSAAAPSMLLGRTSRTANRPTAALLGTAGREEPMAALLGTAGLDPGLAALDAEELVRAYQAGMLEEETLRAVLEERGEMPRAPSPPHSASAGSRGHSRRPSPTGSAAAPFTLGITSRTANRPMAALLGTAGREEHMAAMLGAAGLDPGLAALDPEELVRAYHAGMIDEETLVALLEERGEMPRAPSPPHSASASSRGPSRRPSPTGSAAARLNMGDFMLGRSSRPGSPFGGSAASSAELFGNDPGALLRGPSEYTRRTGLLQVPQPQRRATCAGWGAAAACREGPAVGFRGAVGSSSSTPRATSLTGGADVNAAILGRAAERFQRMAAAMEPTRRNSPTASAAYRHGVLRRPLR